MKSFLDNFYRNLAIFSGHTGFQSTFRSANNRVLIGEGVLKINFQLVSSNHTGEQWEGLNLRLNEAPQMAIVKKATVYFCKSFNGVEIFIYFMY